MVKALASSRLKGISAEEHSKTKPQKAGKRSRLLKVMKLDEQENLAHLKVNRIIYALGFSVYCGYCKCFPIALV